MAITAGVRALLNQGPKVSQKIQQAIERLIEARGPMVQGVRQLLTKRTRYVRFENKYVNSPKFRKQYNRHAKDFGQVDNINTRNQEIHQKALRDHIKDSGTIKIKGEYEDGVIHPGYNYYNPKTSLWAFVKDNGEFHAGWRLADWQVAKVFKTGKVR